jgi:hypothetical protein
VAKAVLTPAKRSQARWNEVQEFERFLVSMGGKKLAGKEARQFDEIFKAKKKAI